MVLARSRTRTRLNARRDSEGHLAQSSYRPAPCARPRVVGAQPQLRLGPNLTHSVLGAALPPLARARTEYERASLRPGPDKKRKGCLAQGRSSDRAIGRYSAFNNAPRPHPLDDAECHPAWTGCSNHIRTGSTRRLAREQRWLFSSSGRLNAFTTGPFLLEHALAVGRFSIAKLAVDFGAWRKPERTP